MAIPIPVTKTKIQSASWGIPITNEVNRLTPLVDAINTRTTPTPWTNMVLMNGWLAESGFVPPQYRRDNDVVEFRGNVSAPAAASGKQIWQAPAGFRVTQSQRVGGFYFDGAAVITKVWRADVTSAGDFTPFDLATSTSFLILTGVRWYLN